jgi:hypothetical protein
VAKKKTRGEWLEGSRSNAEFVSDCITEAAGRVLRPMPYETSDKPKKLIANAAKMGNVLVRNDIEYSFHGGLVNWKRRTQQGKWHPWHNHVAIWCGYDKNEDTLFTVEIKDGHPQECTYPHGSWRKGLSSIVGF